MGVLLKCQNIDVNAINPCQDQTALMRAVKTGLSEIVCEFLKHQKLDVNTKNEAGDTALIAAIQDGNVDVVNSNLDFNNVENIFVKLNAVRALQWARNNGHLEIVYSMLKHQRVQVKDDNAVVSQVVQIPRAGLISLLQNSQSDSCSMPVAILNSMGWSEFLTAQKKVHKETVYDDEDDSHKSGNVIAAASVGTESTECIKW